MDTPKKKAPRGEGRDQEREDLAATCTFKYTADRARAVSEFDQMIAQDDVQDAVMSRAIECAEAWQTPRPLPDNLPPVPAFDPALLPDSLSTWVMDTAERMQVPPDFIAAPAMVAAGVVIGRKVQIRPMRFDSWTVTCNLWGANIGTSGKIKSGSQSAALGPLKRLEQKARERYEERLMAHEADELVAKQAHKETERQIGKAIRSGDQARAETLARTLTENKPEPPTRERLITQDSTVEKLGELLEANPNGIAVVRDELVGLLKSLDKEGHECARAFYLEAWNGDGRFTFDRIGRGTVDVEAACISVFGGIQPGPLRAYVTQAIGHGDGADGLLQRFQLAVWPDVSKKWQPVDRKPDDVALQRVCDLFDRLAALPEPQAGFVRFSDAGQEVFNDWRRNLEQRVRSGEEPEAFEAVLSKQRSLVPSLALICDLCDDPHPTPVSEQAVIRAIAWAEFLEAHARRIFAAALDRQAEAALALGKKIKAGEIQGAFVARDVYRKGWAGLSSRDAVEAALDGLELLGWVRPLQVETEGRTRTDWHVNPRVLP